jgi:YbbR domain-containing protein
VAFVLALIVWVSAVTAADPNQERSFSVPIEIIGQQEDIEIVSEVPDRLFLRLYAPRSILNRLNEESENLNAWVDLSELGPGSHEVNVQRSISPEIRPVRVVEATPRLVNIALEAIITRTLTIQTDIDGDPAQGYQAEAAEWSHQEVLISGRSSLVEQVVEVSVSLDISGADESIERTLALQPLDARGSQVSGVTLTPSRVTVNQPITLRGGYRNVVVRVLTTGQVAEGYRQTNITVSPPNVLIFSADPDLVTQLPGYIETEPLDLSGATDDFETILSLNLPEGITVVGDPNVLVQVGIAAINASLSTSRPVEVIGLLPGLQAQVAPESIDVILFGPVPDLEKLTTVDVRVLVDLTALEVGEYSIAPTVEILPDRIRRESIFPETVEVTITEAATPTPTSTGTITPTQTTQP